MVLAAAVGAAWCSLAFAQVAPPPDATAPPKADAEVAPALIADLDSPDLKTREAASQALAKGSYPFKAVERVLERTDLSPEQRQRLQAAGFQSFRSTPRGAMGVAFTDVTGAGVHVRPVQKGFDAQRVLRADDAIRAIEGQRVETEEEVRSAIIAHDPGDTLALTVNRDGAPLDVAVRLGDYDTLQNGRGLDEQTLMAAWRFRAARLPGAVRAPLSCGLSEEQWSASRARQQSSSVAARSEVTHDPFTGDTVRSPIARPPVSEIVVGGQERDESTRAQAVALAQGSRAATQIIIAGGGQPVLIQRPVPPEFNEAVRRRAMLQTMTDKLAMYNAQIAAMQRAIADTNTPKEKAALWTAELPKLTAERDRLAARIRELAGARDQRP